MADDTTTEAGTGRDGVRRPKLAVAGVALAALTVVAGIAAAVVAAFVVDRDDVERVAAVDPLAPVGLPDGRIAWGERTTGVVRAIELDGFAGGRAEVLARVPDELRTDGQRGLLGLTRREERGAPVLYASWTRAGDGRLVVGRLGDEPAVVWEGPTSTELANGGTLVFRDDELLVAVGDLQDPDAVADPTTVNGKVLALDPDGPPDQAPEVVSGGWHNPYAFTALDGDVWVLDNAPGDVAERIARIPVGGEPVVEELEGRRAPSAVTGDGSGGLLVCGFVSGVVERFQIPSEGVPTESRETDWSCATGVVVVDDDVVTTTLDEVLRFPDEAPG